MTAGWTPRRSRLAKGGAVALVTCVLGVASLSLRARPKTESLEAWVRAQDPVRLRAAVERAASPDSLAVGGCWPAPLHALLPKRIYVDRANSVMVVQEGVAGESGLYVVSEFSSYHPADDREWRFRHVKDGVFLYQRCRAPIKR